MINPNSTLPKRVLLTGATGLIGGRLLPELLTGGCDVTVLLRNPKTQAAGIEIAAGGNKVHIISSFAELADNEPINAVIHLAGEPVASKLWSPRRKQELLDSRGSLPRDIGEWLSRTQSPPTVWLNASAIGFYGAPTNPDQALTEEAEVGTGFAAELCQHIESSAEQALAMAGTKTRLVQLRIGLVLDSSAGYLAKLLLPVKFFAGATLGSGHQWQSWIHLEDTVRAILHCVQTPDIQGPVNLCSPKPERAIDLMKLLGAALHRPVLLKIPAFLLRAAAGEYAEELLLASQRVTPEKLLASGFEFRYDALPEALADLLG